MALKIKSKPKESRLVYSQARKSWSVVEYEKNGEGHWRAARIIETGLTTNQAKFQAKRGIRWGYPSPDLARIHE